MTSITRDEVKSNGAADMWQSVRGILFSQEAILAISLIALILIVGAINPRYLAERNLRDILQGNAYIAIAAIGMSMVIISGNIDISVGSLIGVLTTLCGVLAEGGAPNIVSWTAPLFVGALAGAVNGFLVAYLRIPSIVVTLGMLSILKGGLILVRGGETVYNLPEGFGLAQTSLMGIATPIWFMVILTIVAAVWMRYSTTGRAIYAVGGNAEAARLSGINTKRIIMTVFIINGVTAGIAGVLSATQFTTIQAVVPPGLELSVISAAVVGGVSILGGTGTVIGATLATILLNAIRSSLIFINVSPFWVKSIQGVLILVTVLVDILRRRRLGRRV
jgi:ribose/xylose/arabinose/galactoside ABC-type transport system permease subunit